MHSHGAGRDRLISMSKTKSLKPASCNNFICFLPPLSHSSSYILVTVDICLSLLGLWLWDKLSLQKQFSNRLLSHLVCNRSFSIKYFYLRTLIGIFFSEYRSLSGLSAIFFLFQYSLNLRLKFNNLNKQDVMWYLLRLK